VSRGRYIALVAIVFVGLAVGYLIWENAPRDETERATVGDAVSSFREDGGADEGGRGPLFEREPGVYRYSTQGSEYADTGLLSATHEYDGLSTITVKPAGCGVAEKWQVLGGRWAEFTSCTTERGFFELKGLIEYHEFFGRSRESKYTCTGDSASSRSSRQVGTRFSGRCESKDGDAAISRSRVASIEQVEVGGKMYDAVHTISEVRLEGDVSGSARREDWRRRSDGLLLRRETSSEAKMSGTIGADYEENYTIQLQSIDPET
jgi:hypothetical protein